MEENKETPKEESPKPRAVEAIRQDYFNKCAILGDVMTQQRLKDKEIEALAKRRLELFQEVDALNEEYRKSAEFYATQKNESQG